MDKILRLTNFLNSRWFYSINLMVMGSIYFVLAYSSGQIVSLNPNPALIWLPSGFSLVLILLGGYRYVPAIFIGILIIAFVRGHEFSVVLSLGLADSLTTSLAVYLLKRFNFNPKLQQVKDLLKLISIGGFIPMGIGAIAVTMFLMQRNEYTPYDLTVQFFTLWLGTAMSITFISPFILTWHIDYSLPKRRQFVEFTALLLFTIVVSCLAFSNLLQITTLTHTFYLSLFPLVWAALRFRLREVTFINVITMGFLLWSMNSALGIIYQLELVEKLLVVWSTITLWSIVSISLKMILDDRTRILLELRKERDSMRQILNNLGQGVTVVAVNDTYEYVNPAFASMVGYTAEELIGKNPRTILAEKTLFDLDEVFELRRRGVSSVYPAVLKSGSDEESRS